MDSKKILFKNNLLKKFRTTKIVSQQNFLSPKIFSLKKSVGQKKNVGFNQILHPKNFAFKKIIVGSKIF